MSAEDRGADPGRAGEAPRIALLVITDGRWNYLLDCLESVEANLSWPFVDRILVDDSGPDDHFPPAAAKDAKAFRYEGSTYRIVKNAERQGLAGAIQAGWDALPDCDYVFHLEDDFVFPAPVDLESMVFHLRNDWKLAQVALMRQPWGPDEQAVGSVYGTDPKAYTEGAGIVTHRKLFTFNPCLYPRLVTDYGAGLERDVTDRLLAEGARFAYLGNLNDPPRCWHIGHQRSPGYKL